MSANATQACPNLAPGALARATRWALVGAALTFLAVLLVVPLVAVFVEAFRGGLRTYADAVTDPEIGRTRG